MRIRVLGSGSAGNAMLVEASSTRLLVDAGLGPRILVDRLRQAGVEPETLSAVILTHEHSDHARSAVSFSKKWGIPLRGSAGTREALGPSVSESAGFETVPLGRSSRIGDIDIHPFSVPHDAAEPLAFVLDGGSGVVGVATDLGFITDDLVSGLAGCTTVVIEANYDPGLLRVGPYPWNLKERIASPRGHLANGDVTRFVSRSLGEGCRRLVLAHLSETNNHPDVARMAVAPALIEEGRGDVHLIIAERGGSEWIDARRDDRPAEPPAAAPTQLTLFE